MTDQAEKVWRLAYQKVVSTFLMQHNLAMPQDAPLVRQWLLLKTLSSRRYGVTVRDMAQEMGVNEKTIRRDLQVFRDVGFPLEEEVGDFGRKTWCLRPAWD